MNKSYRTDDFPTIKLKRSTMKLLNKIPDGDYLIVYPEIKQDAYTLLHYEFIYMGTSDSGPLKGQQICYKLPRGESYRNFRNEIDRDKLASNIKSWIAIAISIIALAVSIAK